MNNFIHCFALINLNLTTIVIIKLHPHVDVFLFFLCTQGFVEDQFGLGLIARAVEEGISVIKPMGIMIFNMGGRPGQGVCRRLFERRGFRVTKLWQTKILQASYTTVYLERLHLLISLEMCFSGL